jgi:hypothetical protein
MARPLTARSAHVRFVTAQQSLTPVLLQCHSSNAWYPFIPNFKRHKCKVSPCQKPQRPLGRTELYLHSFLWTSALDGGGWSTPRPGRLYPRKRPGTHCTGGWVGLGAGLVRCGKSRPHRDSIPGPSSP